MRVLQEVQSDHWKQVQPSAFKHPSFRTKFCAGKSRFYSGSAGARRCAQGHGLRLCLCRKNAGSDGCRGAGGWLRAVLEIGQIFPPGQPRRVVQCQSDDARGAAAQVRCLHCHALHPSAFNHTHFKEQYSSCRFGRYALNQLLRGCNVGLVATLAFKQGESSTKQFLSRLSQFFPLSPPFATKSFSCVMHATNCPASFCSRPA